MAPGLTAYMLAAARPKGAPAAPPVLAPTARDTSSAVETTEATQAHRSRSRSPRVGQASFAIERRPFRYTPGPSMEGLVDRLFRLFQPGYSGGFAVNSLGFANATDLAAVFNEEDLDQVVQLVQAGRLPAFEALAYRSEVWIRRSGGVPLAIVCANDIPCDGSWVRE